MQINDNGVYIECSDRNAVSSYGDFVRVVDDEGAVVLIDKNIIRYGHTILKLTGEADELT